MIVKTRAMQFKRQMSSSLIRFTWTPASFKHKKWPRSLHQVKLVICYTQTVSKIEVVFKMKKINKNSHHKLMKIQLNLKYLSTTRLMRKEVVHHQILATQIYHSQLM